MATFNSANIFDPWIGLGIVSSSYKVEASITDELREFCIRLEGVLVADRVFCEEKRIFKENAIFVQKEIHECESVGGFEVVKVTGTYSRSIG